MILLHGFEQGASSRKDFIQEQGLAPFLQEKLRCAVIVPDLRGHGESTKIKVGKQLRPAVGRVLLPTMIWTQDLRAVKDFLWKKNNKSSLNIDKLAVVGVEEGAALALSYVFDDSNGYEQEQAAYGPLKLGKFVKAAVLVSPPASVVGLQPQVGQLMRAEAVRTLPVMIVVGNKNKERYAVAERLYKEFLGGRPPADDARPQSKTVFFFNKIDTSLQGSKLLAEPGLQMQEKIATFLQIRLTSKNEDAKQWKWKKRTLPHE